MISCIHSGANQAFFLRHMRQRLDHHRQRQHRILRMIDKNAADVIAQRHKALLNQLGHQRIPELK